MKSRERREGSRTLTTKLRLSETGTACGNICGRKKEEAAAWDQPPPRSRSITLDLGEPSVGSSILASLSEAGGNDPFHSQPGPFLPGCKRCGSLERDPLQSSANGVPCVRWRFAGRLRFVFSGLEDMAKTVRVWRGPIRDGESEAFPKRNHGKFKNLREPSEQENSRDLGVSRFAAFLTRLEPWAARQWQHPQRH
jgi:hypothetical protein